MLVFKLRDLPDDFPVDFVAGVSDRCREVSVESVGYVGVIVSLWLCGFSCVGWRALLVSLVFVGFWGHLLWEWDFGVGVVRFSVESVGIRRMDWG